MAKLKNAADDYISMARVLPPSMFGNFAELLWRGVETLTKRNTQAGMDSRRAVQDLVCTIGIALPEKNDDASKMLADMAARAQEAQSDALAADLKGALDSLSLDDMKSGSAKESLRIAVALATKFGTGVYIPEDVSGLVHTALVNMATAICESPSGIEFDSQCADIQGAMDQLLHLLPPSSCVGQCTPHVIVLRNAKSCLKMCVDASAEVIEKYDATYKDSVRKLRRAMVELQPIVFPGGGEKTPNDINELRDVFEVGREQVLAKGNGILDSAMKKEVQISDSAVETSIYCLREATKSVGTWPAFIPAKADLKK